MFTKKHFEKVADILASNQVDDSEHSVQDVLHSMADQFAEEFAASNPNFDRDKFMKACGFEE